MNDATAVPMPETTMYALASLLDREAREPCRLYRSWADVWGPTGRYRMDRFDETHDPAEATDVGIPYTLSGDYVGSYMELSNLRYLEEEYGEVLPTWIHHMGFGATELCLNLQGIPHKADPEYWDLLESFVDDVDKLFDYPVLDEELHSLILQEAYGEAVEAWALPDAMHDAEKIFHAERGRYPTPEEETAMSAWIEKAFGDWERYGWHEEGSGRSVWSDALTLPDGLPYCQIAQDMWEELGETFPEEPFHNGRTDPDSFRKRVSYANKRLAIERGNVPA